MLISRREETGVMRIQRKFFNGPIPWLAGLLWADIGVLVGLVLCLTVGGFSTVQANQPAYVSIFAIFLVGGITIAVAIANRQDAERRTFKRPIANACIGLYALSLEVQRFASTLQFLSHNDLNGRAVDLAALREAMDNVERAAEALSPSSILDPAEIDQVLHTGKSIVTDANESFAAACQALDRTVYDRRERWTSATRLASASLIRIGKTIEFLQARL